MKNILTLMALLCGIGFANCQIEKEIKPKEILTTKKTNVTDSIKSKKTLVSDTTIVLKGNFKLFKTNAHASYYAEKFTGRKTASGKIFDNNKYMAAHKNLAFGTKLRVTNPINGKSVIVEVVDRGPFVKGRELDLSRRAFVELSNKNGAGAVIVTIEQLQK